MTPGKLTARRAIFAIGSIEGLWKTKGPPDGPDQRLPSPVYGPAMLPRRHEAAVDEREESLLLALDCERPKNNCAVRTVNHLRVVLRALSHGASESVNLSGLGGGRLFFERVLELLFEIGVPTLLSRLQLREVALADSHFVRHRLHRFAGLRALRPHRLPDGFMVGLESRPHAVSALFLGRDGLRFFEFGGEGFRPAESAGGFAGFADSHSSRKGEVDDYARRRNVARSFFHSSEDFLQNSELGGHGERVGARRRGRRSEGRTEAGVYDKVLADARLHANHAIGIGHLGRVVAEALEALAKPDGVFLSDDEFHRPKDLRMELNARR